MLRVKASKLSYLDDVANYKGALFTGIAYFISGGVIAKVSRFNEGEEVGSYVCEFLPDAVPLISIDTDLLESEDDLEPYLYHDKAFTGLAYDFDGDKCVGEALYRDGILCYEASWYDTGQIATLEILDENLYQNVWWNKDGSYQYVKISEKNSFKLDVRFNEDRLITSVRIEGDYFSRVPFLKEKIRVRFLERRSDICNLELASYLYLAGSGVDDQFLDALETTKGFGGLKKLHVNSSELKGQRLIDLVDQNDLQELLIDDDANKLSEAAGEVKNKYPMCYIEYNRVVLA
ncbi:hypothetical protein [Sessilibacter sp. MAH4]|mgnify:CR=1 FL=1